MAHYFQLVMYYEWKLHKVRCITVLSILILFLGVFLPVNPIHDDPPGRWRGSFNYGTFTLEGLSFHAGDLFFFRNESDPELTDELADDLRNSTFFLNCTIRRINPPWWLESHDDPIYQRKFHYKLRDGYEQFEDNRTPDLHLFTNWDYDASYIFTIQMICERGTDQVRSLSIFNPQYYTSGEFTINGTHDHARISFSNLSGTFFRSSNEPEFIYFGDVTEDNYSSVRILLVELQVSAIIGDGWRD